MYVPCHITTNVYFFKEHTLSGGKDLKQHIVMTFSSSSSFFKINFYWRIVALQCVLISACGKVNQLHIHMIHRCLFGFPSQLGRHRALDRVPCATQEALSVAYFIQHIYVNPNLPVRATRPCPLGIHIFVLYACVSISLAVRLNSQMKWPFILNKTTTHIIWFYSHTSMLPGG